LSLLGNPYDGHTLDAQLAQVRRLVTTHAVKKALWTWANGAIIIRGPKRLSSINAAGARPPSGFGKG
jgi:hypothetical protein